MWESIDFSVASDACIVLLYSKYIGLLASESKYSKCIRDIYIMS